MKESDLRDNLKQNLHLIEKGRELVDDEFYLKNKIGLKLKINTLKI